MPASTLHGAAAKGRDWERPEVKVALESMQKIDTENLAWLKQVGSFGGHFGVLADIGPRRPSRRHSTRG